MWKFQNASIKNKLTLINMITCGIVLLMVTVAFVTNDLISLKKSIVEKLITISKVIGENSSAALTFDDEYAAAEILASLAEEPNILATYLYRQDEQSACQISQ